MLRLLRRLLFGRSHGVVGERVLSAESWKSINRTSDDFVHQCAREWRVEGYRVVVGGRIITSDRDLSGRRVSGGKTIKVVGLVKFEEWIAPIKTAQQEPRVH